MYKKSDVSNFTRESTVSTMVGTVLEVKCQIRVLLNDATMLPIVWVDKYNRMQCCLNDSDRGKPRQVGDKIFHSDILSAKNTTRTGGVHFNPN
jgi:hypothetical protein